MRRSRLFQVKSAMVAFMLLVATPAFAADMPTPFSPPKAEPPKPLTADPGINPTPQKSDKPVNIHAFPDEFKPERQKIKDDYMAWMKSNQEVEDQCGTAELAADRVKCENNRKISAKKLDDIHTRTRDMLRKIDTWRYKMQGLPPPEWWPDPKKQNNQATGGQSGTATTNKDNSVLLPPSKTPLPPGTF